jgi:glycosyltransferase involved in cell wall biosynthesis
MDTFFLLGRPGDRNDPVLQGIRNLIWIDVNSPIYSLSQRFEFKSKVPGDLDLFWSPHFDCAAFWPRKVLVTVHDLYHLALPEFVGGPHKRLYARWMFDRVASEAAGILVISEFTKKELYRLTKVSPEKVQVIPNGLDPFWSEPTSTLSPHPKPYFLFVGNIKPHKNLGRLVEAFGKISKSIPHDLVLVGQKEGFLTGDPGVQKKAVSLGGRVSFTGTIPRDLLKAYYHHAEALVFPSLYEGFGMPPLEAMGCGCPVMASTAASIPEVCGEAALYFDPLDTSGLGEKLLRVIRDGPLRQNLIEKGRSRIKGFSWDKTAEKTVGLVDELIGG